jgi:DNA modification methylase
MEQTRVSEFTSDGNMSEDWTFKGADTNYMTHGLHPYPARMIPQVARKLVLRYSNEGDIVWDPFCGSGTVLVESMLTQRKSIGTDLNPFAIFLSRVKTRPIEPDIIRNAAKRVLTDIKEIDGDSHFRIPTMPNIDYWFKDYANLM